MKHMDYIVEFQAGSKKTAVSRSWILLDNHGESIVADLDKYEIIRRLQIHARDLRILDPMLSYPSAILVREKVIVLNLEHIKAIITAEEVFLRDPFDNNIIPLVEELQRTLSSQLGFISKKSRGAQVEPLAANNGTNTSEKDEFPFEFRALDVVLEAICSYLDARTRELESAAYPALDELTSKISSRNLDRVRKLKSRMTRLTNRVQKVRDELEQLLDGDEHMANLFLSKKMVASPSLTCSSSPNGPVASPCTGSKTSKTSRASQAAAAGQEASIGELEMILETYFTQIDATLNKLTTLREYTDNTEDYINIQLDNQRNQLIQLELLLGSAAVSLALYSLVTAIFGMNIPYTWKEGHAYVFKWVVIVTGLVGASIFLSIIAYARHKGLIGSWHLTRHT